MFDLLIAFEKSYSQQHYLMELQWKVLKSPNWHREKIVNKTEKKNAKIVIQSVKMCEQMWKRNKVLKIIFKKKEKKNWSAAERSSNTKTYLEKQQQQLTEK